MADARPEYAKRFMRRTKTISESSESSVGAESDHGAESPRLRSGSINSKDAAGASSSSGNKMEHFLYDKYLANFFNPLHAKPTGEGVAPETRIKGGMLYDVDGKFAYSTYSEEMRSYHPMLDIKALTKDLK